MSSSLLSPPLARPDTSPSRPASGRPADLLDHHRLVTVTGGPLWEACENFVYDTYVELAYTAASARRHVEELAPYGDLSVFHAVVDDSDAIVGTIRCIFGTYDELPIGRFHPVPDAPTDELCELSSLVVSPSMRSTGVIEHLYREGWLEAYRLGCAALAAIIDDWLLDAFRDHYRLPFRQIGEPRSYMGGDPVPAILLLDGDYDECIDQNPGFASWILGDVTDDELERWGIRRPTLVDPLTRSGAATQVATTRQLAATR